jgi:hypothetical protein
MRTGCQREPAQARWLSDSVQIARQSVRVSTILLPLVLMLAMLTAGCLVIPIPTNRQAPGLRTNITPHTLDRLGTNRVSRTEVLLKLGEPDEVSPQEHLLRYHTERIKWDIYWAVAGGYSADGGDLEVRKYYDLVLHFDDAGRLSEGSWLAGWNPNKLHRVSDSAGDKP